MRKITLMLTFAALLPLGAAAQTPDSLYVVSAGRETPSALDDVRRVDVDSDGISVVLKSDDKGTTYAFADLQTIRFTPSGLPQTTAIAAVKTNGERMSLFVARDGSYVSVNGLNGKSADATIYNIAGAECRRIGSYNGGNISTSDLPHGVYIIKVGGNTAKFRK